MVDDFERPHHDAGLGSEWVERLYVPIRFAIHVMQMTASSHITNCSHFQVADEMHRIQWYADRAKSWLMTHASLADTEMTRSGWEDGEAWQPLQEAFEKVLIAYDWGEAFAAPDVVIKPAVDQPFNWQLGPV